MRETGNPVVLTVNGKPEAVVLLSPNSLRGTTILSGLVALEGVRSFAKNHMGRR
jgi:hypothetical protein